MQHHTTSLQQPENSGIQIYIKCLESILITPTASYDKQVEENKPLLNGKELSNKIIMGKSTEDTAMELDGEGAAKLRTTTGPHPKRMRQTWNSVTLFCISLPEK